MEIKKIMASDRNVFLINGKPFIIVKGTTAKPTYNYEEAEALTRHKNIATSS